MAVLIALTSALLMPIFENLPLAILGAIVISAVMGFINVPAMRRVRYLRKDSFVFALLALIGVLVLGVLPGLLLSIVLSILLLLGRESRPSGSVLGNLPGTRALSMCRRIRGSSRAEDLDLPARLPAHVYQCVLDAGKPPRTSARRRSFTAHCHSRYAVQS